MNRPTNGITNNPTIAAAVAIRIGVLGIRSRRMVLPVSTSEALMPTRASAAAMTPVDQDADDPMIQAQATMVMIATGEPGTTGKMVPKIATSMRTAAIMVVMTSTGAVYSSKLAVARGLVFNGGVDPDEVVGTVIGAHSEETSVVVSVFGICFENAGVQHTHV